MIDKPLLGQDTYLDPKFADGLVACWLMNEGSGSKIYDLSGNGYDGTFVADTVWVPGQYGHAIDLDGTGDLVSMGDVIDLSAGHYSAAIWVNLDSSQTAWAAIISRGTSGGGGNDWAIGRWDTEDEIVVFHASASMRFVGAGSKILGQGWKFLGFSYSNGVGTLYIDGIQFGSLSEATAPGYTASRTFRIGASRDPIPIAGQISHCYMWDRTLTDSEISNLNQDPFWGFRNG